MWDKDSAVIFTIESVRHALLLGDVSFIQSFNEQKQTSGILLVSMNELPLFLTSMM